MRLSWNEIRTRAAAFAREWKDATYEKGETQSFYNHFFRVFGVKRRTVARYEAHVTKLDNRSGFIDLFWPGVLLV
ncbi:type IIL restriction-modification enzyme MmeI, partial [Candidatus Synechococcus spongiarum]